MTTNVSIHGVTHIETSGREELKTESGEPFTVRYLTITQDNGEVTTITLFADEYDALTMRGDRL